MRTALEALIILTLILLNGAFAMSELALVSARPARTRPTGAPPQAEPPRAPARRARLAVLERKGVPGARAARLLQEDPQRFLPTVQVGVTLISILVGTFAGARVANQLQPWVAQIPGIGRAAGGVSLTIVVIVITYLTMVLGELVPKQLALRRPELIAIGLARPIAFLATITSPVVWLLGRSSHLVLR